MIFFAIVIILFQIGVAFFLAQKKYENLKEELAREKLIIEGKENQIVKLKNCCKRVREQNSTI